MNTLIFAFIIILNVCISVWNCYAVGSAWKDTMAFGGGLLKAVLYSGVVQSAIGFSLPILLLLAWIATTVLGMPGDHGKPPMLTPDQIHQFWVALTNLWYIAVILPCLGTGYIITAHSLREAYRRKDFASIATAGWNSFASISNTIDAVQNLGGAWGNVGDFISAGLGDSSDDDDNKFKLVILLFVLVIIALMLGIMIAIGLTRYFARQTESRLEQYADTLPRSKYARA